MRPHILSFVLLLAAACGEAPQPESAKTAAAFEIPLPSKADRQTFLEILRGAAATEGLHVDVVPDEELLQAASVSPAFNATLRAGVWRGEGDDEPIAAAMDQPDHLGQIWITFFQGKDPALNSRFREAAMREVLHKWPGTLRLPIMPSGAIPLHRDLLQTPEGYVVKPNEAHKYELQSGRGTPK